MHVCALKRERERVPGVFECGKRERGRESECMHVHQRERERVTKSI